jgi:hypothetical protein
MHNPHDVFLETPASDLTAAARHLGEQARPRRPKKGLGRDVNEHVQPIAAGTVRRAIFSQNHSQRKGSQIDSSTLNAV